MGARVNGTAEHGFFVAAGNHQLFVRPSEGSGMAPRSGDTVGVQGVVLRMPDRMEEQLKGSAQLNDEIYVYATDVNR